MSDDQVNPDWANAVRQAMHDSSVNRDTTEAMSEDSAVDTPVTTPRMSPSPRSPRAAPRASPKAPFRISFPKAPVVNVGEDSDLSISESEDLASASSRSRSSRLKDRQKHNRQDEEQEKYELLSRIQHMVTEKGYKSFRQVGPSDSIHDVRYEFFRAQREISKRTSVKLMAKYLVTFTNVVEMVADYYNPLNLKLAGYSKSVLLSMKDYEPILEELHYKYSDSVSVSPEVKLVMALASSMFFYHTGNHFMSAQDTTPTTQAPFQASFQESQGSMHGPRAPRMPDMGMGMGLNPLSMMMKGASGGINPMDLMSGLSMVQSLMADSNK